MIFQYVGILFLLSTLPLVDCLSNALFTKVALCMVVSDQENAKIYINDKDTLKITPSLIKIPLNREVKINLVKHGYEDHEAFIRGKNELSFYYADLKKFEFKILTQEMDQSV